MMMMMKMRDGSKAWLDMTLCVVYSVGRCVNQALHCCDKQLKGGFILAHSFRGFCLWSAGSTAVGLR
jgi:hypothetical protein